MNDAQNDRPLVDLFLQSRDEAAFRQLYRQHAAAVHAFVRRFLGASDPEVPDLVQDIWSRAVDALPRFAWRSSLRTWLIGIAVNRCREYGRQRGTAVAASEEEMRELDQQPDRASLETADRLDLERSVSALPLGYREVLVLHDIHGYTHDEIGEILGVTAGTSKSQLSRARGALRTALGAASLKEWKEHDVLK